MNNYEQFTQAKINLFDSFKIKHKENKHYYTSRIHDYTNYNWRTCKETRNEDFVYLDLWEQNEENKAIVGSFFKEIISTIYSNRTHLMAYDKDMDCFYILEKSMRGKYTDA